MFIYFSAQMIEVGNFKLEKKIDAEMQKQVAKLRVRYM